MANVKFSTVRGSSTISTTPFYVGMPQHERTMSKKETYNYCAEKTGYSATAIRAVFLAMREVIRENAAKGNITYMDGVASIRHYVKGSFESLTGPWVKGKNALTLLAVEMDPFKGVFAGVTPINNTEGAKPTIASVLDETTHAYDIITGTNTFSVAGTDLNPDTTKADEYLALTNKDGVETKATISYSDLQNVKAALTTALPAGDYTLTIYTRSGMGEEFGVKMATRKVVIV